MKNNSWETSDPSIVTVGIERIIQNGFPISRLLPHLKALGVFAGQGEETRYDYLDDLVGRATGLEVVLSAGAPVSEKIRSNVTSEEILQRRLGKRAPSRLYVLPDSQYVTHQAGWMLRTAMNERLPNLGVIASWWQLPQLWRTMIRDLITYSNNMWIPIIPIPAPMLVTDYIPEGRRVRVWDELPNQIGREIRLTGDVASDGEVMTYLKWLKACLPGS